MVERSDAEAEGPARTGWRNRLFATRPLINVGHDPSAEERHQALVDGILSLAILTALGIVALYGLLAGAGADWLAAGPCGGRAPCEGVWSALDRVGRALGGMALALSLAGAALAIGALAGFIFGLPRSLTSAEARELSRRDAEPAAMPEGAMVSNGGASAGTSGRPTGYGTNSNLERISDWLTTIIVGLGLINLPSLTGSIELFGDRVAGSFGFGGKLFGISCGLYFLILGFLLSYLNTRTRIVLLFTGNDLAAAGMRAKTTHAFNTGYALDPITGGAGGQAAANAAAQTITSPQTGGTTSAPVPSKNVEMPKEVKELANKSAFDAGSPKQLLAIANAKAATGDYAAALNYYRDVFGKSGYVFTDDDLTKFASIIGLNGDTQMFGQLEESLRLINRENMAIELGASFVNGVRKALQDNLYNGRYEDSIRLGRLFFERSQDRRDAWAHLWMACAYGQRHRALSATAEEANAEAIDDACDQAAFHVRMTREIDPALTSYLYTLAYPEPGATDNDLASVAACLDDKGVLPAPEDQPPPAT